MTEVPFYWVIKTHYRMVDKTTLAVSHGDAPLFGVIIVTSPQAHLAMLSNTPAPPCKTVTPFSVKIPSYVESIQPNISYLSRMTVSDLHNVVCCEWPVEINGQDQSTKRVHYLMAIPPAVPRFKGAVVHSMDVYSQDQDVLCVRSVTRVKTNHCWSGDWHSYALSPCKTSTVDRRLFLSSVHPNVTSGLWFNMTPPGNHTHETNRQRRFSNNHCLIISTAELHY